ncbi:MAG: ATP-binding protein [Deltaproteobacteria bacterium]|jgi:nitrogen-specific signal transduction histidine kinase|nr:ATP-binding protein [Deltaproteobacteria bacterium]
MRGIHDLSCERTRKIKVCGADLNDYVDRPQMELAVETLVKKALNQMREGSTLSIATLKENNTFKLVMRYPVEHIARDDVRHFFYPFTTTRMPYDTVDLPMSKILVDKHGREIDVRLKKPGEMFIYLSIPLPDTIIANIKS